MHENGLCATKDTFLLGLAYSHEQHPSFPLPFRSLHEPDVALPIWEGFPAISLLHSVWYDP